MLLGGCSLNPRLRLDEVVPDLAAVELADVPFYAQEDHHCGPASLLTVLEASGVEVDYSKVVDHVYVPGLEGSLQAELQAAGRSFGRIAYPVPPRPEAVLAEVAAGRPVLVLLNLGLPNRAVWHYAVVVGYDARKNRVVLRSGRTERSVQKAPAWLRRWDWAGRWGLVLLRPGEWPAVAERERVLSALGAFEEQADAVSAGRAWGRAVQEWPEEAYAWLGVGNAESRRDRWDQAWRAYERALSLAPDLSSVRFNLAVALAEVGKPCESVDVLLEASAEENPFEARYARLVNRLARECRSP